MTDPVRDTQEGVRLARRAVELGKNDAVALARGGHALAHFSHDLGMGIDFLDRALVINPSLAAAWLLGGFLRLFKGEPDEAIQWLERAMRLSPFDSEMFRMETGVAMAHLIAGRFDAASSGAANSFRAMPALVLPGAVVAASHALGGRMDEARSAIQIVRQFNPTLRLGTLHEWLPFRLPQHAALFADGLRKAGLPE